MLLKFTLLSFGCVALPHFANANSVRVELRKVVDGDSVIFEEIKPIIDANCIGCHGKVSPKAGLNLADYPFTSTRIADLSQIVDKMLVRVNDIAKPMPPKTKESLTADQIALIQSWKDGGLQTERISEFVTVISLVGEDGGIIKEESHESSVNPFEAEATYDLVLPDAATGTILQ